MARLLRNSSFLKTLLSDPRSCRRGLLAPSSEICSFSTKGRKKKSKSTRRDPGDENLSPKDLNLKKAMEQIETSFGKGSITWLGRGASPKEVPVVSTGSFGLDIALGVGGFPKGRVVEIYGPQASGKTTLALHAIAEAQKQGGYCVFVDAEHAFDSSLAEKIGVNTQDLLLWQPDCGEQALGFVDTITGTVPVDVVVVDNVAALVPKRELEGEVGDSHIAMHARLMSQALRKLSHSLSLSQTILIFINQVRPQLSSFGGFGGPTEFTGGGNALKFYASIRLNIRRIGAVKKGAEIVGSQILVEVVKNKHAPPFKTAEFELELGRGISRESELIELGIKHKFVQKNTGPSYIFNEQRFCRKEDIKKYLISNPEVKGELTMKLREKLLAPAVETGLDGEDPDEEKNPPDCTDEELISAAEVRRCSR